jgi:YVTN family beta-propeller protein
MKASRSLPRLLPVAAVAAFLLFAAPQASARIAYTGNFDSATVSMIDLGTNQVVGPAIPVGELPGSTAVTPNGRTLYVANEGSEDVTVIDTATNMVIATIPLGGRPGQLSISPNGAFAYVSLEDKDAIVAINTQTNQIVGTPIPAGKVPWGIAVSPDGSLAYVVDIDGEGVSVINTMTGQTVGTPIPVGATPFNISLTPDGKTALVANFGGDTVSVLDLTTRQAVATIPVGLEPWGVAISPDGTRAYVSNEHEGSVSVIDIPTKKVIGAPIQVGKEPFELMLSPDGKTLYVPNYESSSVSVIATQTLQVTNTIPISKGPWQLAIVPDQSPTASFTVGKNRLERKPIGFNGSASTDLDGAIAKFDWKFGDGAAASNSGATTTHTYAKFGKKSVGLTVTDNEGCSAALVFTGRIAYCSGSAGAAQTQSVKVVAPNDFKFGRLERNPKDGTAKLQVKVPAGGKLVLIGSDLMKVERKTRKQATLVLPIKPMGRLKRLLGTAGQAKARIKVRFSPLGGKPRVKSRALKLTER